MSLEAKVCRTVIDLYSVLGNQINQMLIEELSTKIEPEELKEITHKVSAKIQVAGDYGVDAVQKALK